MVTNKHSYMDYKLTTIQEGIPDNLYISCISYEPRSGCLMKTINGNYKAEAGLFIINDKFKDFKKVIENKKSMEHILDSNRVFDDATFLITAIDNPIKIIIEIDKIIKTRFSERDDLNITLDITTFPRNELLTLMYYLRHNPSIKLIRIMYISPERYGSWLSEGYRYSMIPPFFEGAPNFEKKTALIVFTGFEYDRAISLIEDIEPSLLVLGKPYPGTSEEFKHISEDITNKLKRTRKIINACYEIPANDPFLCRDRLKKIIKNYSQSYDFYVAPMGTKLEVIGAYLAYEENANYFRFIYPIPLIYNVVDYSFGCRDVYEILLKYDQNGKE